jgi:hypothetical protein
MHGEIRSRVKTPLELENPYNSQSPIIAFASGHPGPRRILVVCLFPGKQTHLDVETEESLIQQAIALDVATNYFDANSCPSLGPAYAEAGGQSCLPN